MAEVSNEVAIRWMSLDFTKGKSTLVQVMAWCRQATSHYLSQCWPRSLSPYGVTRTQCVKFVLPQVTPGWSHSLHCRPFRMRWARSWRTLTRSSCGPASYPSPCSMRPLKMLGYTFWIQRNLKIHLDVKPTARGPRSWLETWRSVIW